LARNFDQHDNNDLKPEGTEVVRFTVTPSGELSDFAIINSVSREIDKEIIRVLETTNGMWIPGNNDNVPTGMTKEVSLAFCIKNNSSKSVTEIFKEKATNCYFAGSKALFEKQNPKKALKYYNWGINYLPNDQSLLLGRGICRYETGDKEGARQDWERLKSLGGFEIENWELTENAKGLKSYDELTSIFKD
jgi:tetratricopeptide (TPR) repeat protein